jgi:hypothetical protein
MARDVQRRARNFAGHTADNLGAPSLSAQASRLEEIALVSSKTIDEDGAVTQTGVGFMTVRRWTFDFDTIGPSILANVIPTLSCQMNRGGTVGTAEARLLVGGAEVVGGGTVPPSTVSTAAAAFGALLGNTGPAFARPVGRALVELQIRHSVPAGTAAVRAVTVNFRGSL